MGLFSSKENPVHYEAYSDYSVPYHNQVMREIVEDKIAQRREAERNRRREELERQWERRQQMELMQRREEERIRRREVLERQWERREQMELMQRREEERNRRREQLERQWERREQIDLMQGRQDTLRRQERHVCSEELMWKSIEQLRNLNLNEQVRKNTAANQQLGKHSFLQRLTQKKITKNLPLLEDLSRAFFLPPLSRFPKVPYTQKILLESCEEFKTVHQQFRRKNKRWFKIDSIVKIDNVFLLLQYRLTLKKYLKNNVYTDGKNLFHGTKHEFVDSICTFNFDRSKVNTHKFGWGVSFAVESFYATFYHRANKKKMDKVMIMADVIMESVEVGDPDTTIPSSCYTSRNQQGSVIVKYDDASYYPAYIIYYRGMHYNQQPKNMSNKC